MRLRLKHHRGAVPKLPALELLGDHDMSDPAGPCVLPARYQPPQRPAARRGGEPLELVGDRGAELAVPRLL